MWKKSASCTMWNKVAKYIFVLSDLFCIFSSLRLLSVHLDRWNVFSIWNFHSRTFSWVDFQTGQTGLEVLKHCSPDYSVFRAHCILQLASKMAPKYIVQGKRISYRSSYFYPLWGIFRVSAIPICCARDRVMIKDYGIKFVNKLDKKVNKSNFLFFN